MRFSHLAILASSAIGALADGDKETMFNGVTVPTYFELTPSNWEDEMRKSKFMMVKHYSPYCGHCIAFAPTFQTLYELYYTSKPGKDGKEEGSFTDYYDFRFGQLDCSTYSDTCEEHGVKQYPTTVIYENGVEVEKISGGKSMEELSAAIERVLNKSKPGSRPESIDLPEPGANSSPKAKGVPRQVAAKNKNADGKSISLTAEDFDKHVTQTQDAWFIKFYAPWCHHCQALAPNWEQLATGMKDKLNIGEVNCDKEKRLCKDADVKGFPTIVFFRGGERVDYEGLRGYGDLVSYADNAIELSNGIPDVDAKTFAEMETKNDVIFVYFYDVATTTEDFRALERLPLSLVGHAKLVKTKDPELFKRFKITTWPRMMVAREGRPTYYPPLTPNEMRDVRAVLRWMKSVWLPLIPEISATNARQIMENKLVVLGVLDRNNEHSFKANLKEMKSAANEWMDRQIIEFQAERKKLRDAKQMRIEEAEDRNDERALRSAKALRINMDTSSHKEVAFAWVDGAFWQRWIRTTYGIDLKDGERVIINDQRGRKYYDTTVTGNHILVSRTSIMETLDKVVYGPNPIKPKYTVSFIEKIFYEIKMAFIEHTFVTILTIIVCAYIIITWYRGSTSKNRTRGMSFRHDDPKGMKEMKDGLLGSPSSPGQKSD